MPKLASLAAVLAAASTASAQNVVATAESPPPPTLRQVDARIGLLVGAVQVGDTENLAPGVSVGIGYRIGDLSLRALGDYYRVGDDPATTAMPRRGRGTRVGGAARYSFAHTDPNAFMALDLWGELGGGYEHVSWLAGGVLDRPSAEAAFGLDGSHRYGHGDRRRAIGYFFAFRTHVAEAPEMAGAVATCGGPCSQPTKPSRTDVTMFFETGVHWGR